MSCRRKIEKWEKAIRFRFSWRVLLLPILYITIIQCTRQDESANKILPASDEQDSHTACSLIEMTEPIFGPMEFHRSTGKPIIERERFHAPLDGEICVVIINGLHEPPKGHRVSSAWIYIDDVLVIDPEPFSQVAAKIISPFAVSAGEHELSVKLASKPESYLSIELRLLADDTEPPIISIEPADSAQVDTDMPLVRISYTDNISGIDINSISIMLNGMAISDRFEINETDAIWQVSIDSYLEEGENKLIANVADRRGNIGNAISVFQVFTSTDELLEDLESNDSLHSQRSAYKLIFRTEELSYSQFLDCLKQLNETPESKAVNRLAEILQTDENDHIVRTLLVGAIGEIARIDYAVSNRNDIVDILGQRMLEDPSHLVKSMAARAMGLTQNYHSLTYFDSFVDYGFIVPPEPEDCELPISQQRCFDYITYVVLTGFQVVKSIVRIAGHEYIIDNPGDVFSLRDNYLDMLRSHVSYRE